MMNAMDNLFARRSIRSFTGEPLERETIGHLLKAAYAAPVGMGRYDSLHITVVTNREYLDALQEAFAVHTGRPGAQPLYGAPALIILSSVFPGIPTDNSSYSNTAIISQNIALAATAMTACAAIRSKFPRFPTTNSATPHVQIYRSTAASSRGNTSCGVSL